MDRPRAESRGPGTRTVGQSPHHREKEDIGEAAGDRLPGPCVPGRGAGAGTPQRLLH